jgi:hypothetical protein
MGLAALPFAAWLFLGAYNSIGLCVRAYADGFTVSRRNTTDVFRWEDVSTVRVVPYEIGSGRARTHYLAYHVTREDGAKAALDQANLPGVPTLGARVVEEVSARLLPAVIQAYERGEEITFGEHGSAFTVSKQGLRRRDDLLAWDDLSGVAPDLQRNRLYIVQRGAPGKRDRTWARPLLSTVPNAAVFVKLVEHIRS